MGLASVLYHSVAKRTSTFVLAIGVSAFVFERGKWKQQIACLNDWIQEKIKGMGHIKLI